MIPIVTGTFGTVTKGLVQELEHLEIRGQVETIQTTAFLRSARILVVSHTQVKNHQLMLVWKTPISLHFRVTLSANLKKLYLLLFEWNV